MAPTERSYPKPPKASPGVAGESITANDRILSPISLIAAPPAPALSAVSMSPLVFTRPATGVPSATVLTRMRSADDADDGGLWGVRDALTAALGVDAAAKACVLVPLCGKDDAGRSWHPRQVATYIPSPPMSSTVSSDDPTRLVKDASHPHALHTALSGDVLRDGHEGEDVVEGLALERGVSAATMTVLPAAPTAANSTRSPKN